MSGEREWSLYKSDKSTHRHSSQYDVNLWFKNATKQEEYDTCSLENLTSMYNNHLQPNTNENSIDQVSQPKIKPLLELKQLQASTSKTLLKPVNKPALKPINKFVNLNYDYAPELAISPSNSNKSPTDIKVIEIIDDDEKILDTSVKKISVQCEFCSQQFSKYQDLQNHTKEVHFSIKEKDDKGTDVCRCCFLKYNSVEHYEKHRNDDGYCVAKL